MSHFLYAHKDVSGHENVWKIGVTLTPYSAVRSRQKVCWDQFGLDYLWFGNPYHIEFIENEVKKKFKYCSGKELLGFGTQTEMFQIEFEQISDYISTLINVYELAVKAVEMDAPYTATSSGKCPFGIPSEISARHWLDQRFQTLFNDNDTVIAKGYSGRGKVKMARNNFNRLFEL